jgi:hypothetical protein
MNLRSASLALLLMMPAFGQTAKKWIPPHTPDGQPDLQGVWATATLTPVERPDEFANKEFLTEREAAEYTQRTLGRINTDNRSEDSRADLNGHYNEFWRDRASSVIASRRTSLVVDPPDGRIPLTAEGRQRRAEMVAAEALRRGPEDLPLRLRCITRGLPMLPTPNNNFLQIVQTHGYVAILQEMMYEARIIPLNGPPSKTPHAPVAIRGYLGDPRGWWEGNTLVIDTTNFSHQHEFYGSHEGLHLVERLTRVDPNNILYEFTVDDPTTFTKPWSVAMPMRKSQEGGVFPYECHEGNYSLMNILEGARAEERAATTRDATTRDATTRDATTRDAPTRDAPTRDATTRDAPRPDAPTRDATTRDATTRDAPTPDAPSRDRKGADIPNRPEK